jgi:RimJ/RimL family protein N-acetyltransferase
MTSADAHSYPRLSIGRRTLAFLRRMGVGYSCFKVYSLLMDSAKTASVDALPAGHRFAEISSDELKGSPFSELRDCDSYGGEDSHLFGIFRDDGILVCVQCVWFGDRYRRQAFWPLEADDAASVHLVTAAPERGRGLATRLKQRSAERLREMGFVRLYSRIWWTNTASLRVSEKAGWTQVGTVLEFDLPWLKGPVRRVFAKRGK